MKRICLFLPSLRGGGAERVMLILANGFAERGYSVDLVLAKAEGAYLKSVSNQVKIVDLNKSRMLLSLFPFVSYLRRNKPDVVLSAMNHVNVIAVIAKSFSLGKFKLIISEHSNLSVSSRFNKGFKNSVVNFLVNWIYKKADSIVAVSNGVADDLSRVTGISLKRISTIYNPVVTDELLRLKSIRPDSFIDNDKYILSVGRFVTAKDFNNLIEAYSKSNAKSEYKLVILGDGELREGLEEKIKELSLDGKVLLPGFVDNPFYWMANAELFVMSSVYEGLSNVLIEAMACGAAVVSTDCPSGPAEILENGKWGRLVPVSNSEALAQGIDQELQAEQKNTFERALFFTDKNSIEKYLKLIEN
ncbi:glycosyltransferase [Ignatzschineria indica]|uniref:glycosyltransferase n=1 Tax=Ignatzschineria indica TaxID=472583 RepID=UPI002574CE2F|nr:glycosyltransferase [Ignatzschineria indica]MDM1545268.1 glycosyltransferase [Ignatzschineria indica]